MRKTINQTRNHTRLHKQLIKHVNITKDMRNKEQRHQADVGA